jgi:hypothetical protein
MVPGGNVPHEALREEVYDKTVRDWVRDQFYETPFEPKNF